MIVLGAAVAQLVGAIGRLLVRIPVGSSNFIT